MIHGIVASRPRSAASAVGDPFYDQVVANLHFDAADGSTTFIDEKGHTFTAAGNAQIDTAQSQWGGSALLLDGTGDWIQSADSADWTFGTGDWTVDCWVRFNTDPGTGLATFVCSYDSVGNQRGWVIGLNNNTLRLLYSTTGSDTPILSTAWNPAASVWYYISVVRRGPTIYFFVDGILLGTASIGTASIFNSTAPLQIGTQGLGANGDVNGWIDDVRITKAARYTTSFSRPTRAHANVLAALGDEFWDQTVSQLPLNTSLSDGKSITWTAAGNAALTSAQSVFGGNSLALDGTGDWLDATSANFAWGTGDFTIECWVRYDTRSGNNFAFTFGGGWGVYTFSGQWAVFDGSASNVIGPAGTVADDTWYHVALCRRGTSLRLFVDGVQVGSTATNSTNFSNQAIRIGAQPTGTGTVTGWIDDFRATAYARYVSDFQVPVLANPTRKGDKFFEDVVSLIHWDGTNGSTTYTDQIVTRTWTNGTNGGSLDTSDKKYGSASVKFTGSSNNQIDSDSGSDFTYGTADWTIEWWFKTPSNAGTIMIWDQRISGGANDRACIFQQSGSLLFYTGTTRITGTTPILSATWQHYAVSKKNGVTKMFVDGVQIGSNFTDTINYLTGRVRLGTNGDTGGGFGTNSGWYDDIRVTKGIGRYSANFSPPPGAYADSF